MTTTSAEELSNETVVDTYDRVARLYDWFLSPVKGKTRRRALDLLGIDGGEIAVEIGCGPGHALVELDERVGPTGAIVGLDAAPGMVDRAHRRLHRDPPGERVELLLGDARTLPIRAETVDIAFVEDTLELFSETDMATVVGELRRILRDDGRLCVVTMERADAEEGLFVRSYDWLFRTVPGYRRFGCRPVYASHIIEAGGFEVVRRERHRRAGVWPVDILLARPV